jgi:hypothetical protein
MPVAVTVLDTAGHEVHRGWLAFSPVCGSAH